jgi:hypothetical protein
MANEERRKEDLFIKKERRAKNFFVTASDVAGKVNKTTISSSVFTEMSKSFANGEHLTDDGVRELNGGILYMLQEMQQDIDDVYNEVSASAFQASFFPFARIDSGSFGVISSSLVPDNGEKHNLGSSGKEWHTSYQTTASIGGGIFTSASLAAGGGNTITVDTTLKNGSTNPVTNNAVFDGLALKLNLTGGKMTGLIQPIVQTISSVKNNTVDVQKTNVVEVSSKAAVTITAMTTAFPGQEVTIVNINSGTITITHTAKATNNTFNTGGKNLSITTNQAYKFVMTNNNQWITIQ